MVDLTILIMTFNEKIHIERCIRSVMGLTDKIIIIDSFSTDHTVPIAQALGVKVVQRTWKNQADQFQWGLEQFGSQTEWIMRMDADEYLEPDLITELQEKLPALEPGIDGIHIKRKVFFEGKWIRFGGSYPQTLLRIWRKGKGRCEQRWMDEHMVLPPSSKTVTAKGHIVDDNLKGITFWTEKHNIYASREAADLLNRKYALFSQDTNLTGNLDSQAKRKRFVKEKGYSRLPTGWRAFAYFCYRYFLLLGFLDGRKGFSWHFLQGWWYRYLVDVKIREIEERCSGDPEKIRELLKDQHGVLV
ncbi:MAG TPA: glycosyltransferase family 2 protein [Longilinea sp.]|nr:glycosyltransferase family 2 protein [Longilinea sp.]